MQPLKTHLTVAERGGDTFLIQRELGSALRQSFGSAADEPVPSTMALLLVRLAFAEVVRTAAENELGERAARSE